MMNRENKMFARKKIEEMRKELKKVNADENKITQSCSAIVEELD